VIESSEARVSASALKDIGRWRWHAARDGRARISRIVTLYDPPRPDAKSLIATLHDRRHSMKMLTGDALAVASEIAHGVGLSNNGAWRN